jgi:glycosyltransferase involved in cell wall biosynthesis
VTGRRGNLLAVFEGYHREPTGAERMALRAAERLADRGWSVAALTSSARAATRDTLAAAGVVTVGSEAELAREAPGWTPDVVHGFDLARPDLLAVGVRLAERFRARYALTPCSAPEVWPDPARARGICAAADVLFAVSRQEVQVLRQLGVPQQRIHRIPHASDLAGSPRPAEFRRRHQLDGPVVLYVGRRAAFKGYLTLLRSTSLVWRSLPRARFVFIGPDSDADAPAHFAAHADPRIHDLGVADEPAKHDALAACDVLCLPTTADVFPLVFIEAWLCGKPVVTGDFRGATRVVRHGVDGLVVRATPRAVATALVDLLADPRRRTAFGEAGRQRAAQQFGWDRVADAYEAGYPTGMPVAGGPGG